MVVKKWLQLNKSFKRVKKQNLSKILIFKVYNIGKIYIGNTMGWGRVLSLFNCVEDALWEKLDTFRLEGGF